MSSETKMMNELRLLANCNGTPLLVLDHNRIRENCVIFREHFPKVQAYYAVKANPNHEIVKTLFDEGMSFDVASFNEFMQVYGYIKHMAEKEKDLFIWDKIIFSNTVKDCETLKKINRYKPLVTYDNLCEIEKISEYCNSAGLILRLKVPDSGSQVEMSSKFGAEPSEAINLIKKAFNKGLKVEGLSFHVGSQCLNAENYISALTITAEIFKDARNNGFGLNIIDIGGGFPVSYDKNVPEIEKIASVINSECRRLFPEDIELIAEPGRFLVANAATLITKIIGRAKRSGKVYYHIDDGVYHTFSGIVYDNWKPNFKSFKEGDTSICAVVGPTCDSFDKISLAVSLPDDLRVGEYLVTENIGAYSTASSTKFNGFYGAKIIHIL